MLSTRSPKNALVQVRAKRDHDTSPCINVFVVSYKKVLTIASNLAGALWNKYGQKMDICGLNCVG